MYFPQTIQFGDSAVLLQLMPDAGRANLGFVCSGRRRGGVAADEPHAERL